MLPTFQALVQRKKAMKALRCCPSYRYKPEMIKKGFTGLNFPLFKIKSRPQFVDYLPTVCEPIALWDNTNLGLGK